MTKQRMFSLFTVLALLLNGFSINAMAAVIPPDSPQESRTLSGYCAEVEEGSSDGEIIITCDVKANRTASSVGVNYIRIYDSSSNLVEEIIGSTSNGWVRNNAVRLLKTYHFYGDSGTTYYVIVEVFATINGVTDSRVIGTDDITAP